MNGDIDECLDDRIFAGKRTGNSKSKMVVDDGRDQPHSETQRAYGRRDVMGSAWRIPTGTASAIWKEGALIR